MQSPHSVSISAYQLDKVSLRRLDASHKQYSKIPRAELRLKAECADNSKIKRNFKKQESEGYRKCQFQIKFVADKKNETDHSGKRIFSLVSFFLIKSVALNPCFLKQR